MLPVKSPAPNPQQGATQWETHCEDWLAIRVAWPAGCTVSVQIWTPGLPVVCCFTKCCHPNKGITTPCCLGIRQVPQASVQICMVL